MPTLKCPNCNSPLVQSKEVFGLVKFDQNEGRKLDINNNVFLPVKPIICQNCNHIEFKLAKIKKVPANG